MTDPLLNIIFDDFGTHVYDYPYLTICSTLVVDIFHKGIIP